MRGGARLAALPEVRGRLLDYGAGLGTFALAAAALGHPVVAIEPNILCCAFMEFRACRHSLDIVVLAELPDRIQPVETVVLLNVLQHIPEWAGVLSSLLPCLEKSGRVIETTEFKADPHEKSTRVEADIAAMEGIFRRAGYQITAYVEDCRVWMCGQADPHGLGIS